MSPHAITEENQKYPEDILYESALEAKRDVGRISKILESQICENNNLKKEFEKLESKLKSDQEKFNIEIDDYRKQIDYLNIDLNRKLNLKDKMIEIEIKKIEEERLRYQDDYQEKLQENSKKFVEDTVRSLVKREKYLSKMASIWSILGAIVLFFGLIASVYIALNNNSGNINNINWPSFLFYLFKGTIILTLIGFFTRYNFVLSGNYMKESLKTDNRINGIKFGQFYIETYGSFAPWSEVREAFSNWNENSISNWKDTLQYDELNNAMSTLSDAIKKFKVEAPSGTSDKGDKK